MSNKFNYPFSMRIRYRIDNFMSKGSSSIFLALLALFMVGFIVMVIFRIIANYLIPDEKIIPSDGLASLLQGSLDIY